VSVKCSLIEAKTVKEQVMHAGCSFIVTRQDCSKATAPNALFQALASCLQIHISHKELTFPLAFYRTCSAHLQEFGTLFFFSVFRLIVKVNVKLFLCLTERHAMRTYWWSGGIALRILDFGTRWRWVVSFTLQPLYSQGKSPWYPSDRRLGGPQSRSGRDGEEKNSQPPPRIEP
jgi:hypothetical protein